MGFDDESGHDGYDRESVYSTDDRSVYSLHEEEPPRLTEQTQDLAQDNSGVPGDERAWERRAEPASP